jgi:hypothetical protein
MSELTLESSVVIRVGAPDAPYAVAVVRDREGLHSGRFLVDDFDAMPPIGTPLVEIDRIAERVAVYAPAPSA